jgi:hypothetical protein
VGADKVMLRLIVMLVLGRLMVWALQTSGPTRRFWRLHPILKELGECDFCLGVWVFLALDILLRVNITDPYYMPYISEVVTAVTVSFAVHLARIGWSVNYGVLDLTED